MMRLEIAFRRSSRNAAGGESLPVSVALRLQLFKLSEQLVGGLSASLHGAVGSQECFRAFSVQTDLLTQLRELGGKGTHVFIRGFDGITHRTQ